MKTFNKKRAELLTALLSKAEIAMQPLKEDVMVMLRAHFSEFFECNLSVQKISIQAGTVIYLDEDGEEVYIRREWRLDEDLIKHMYYDPVFGFLLPNEINR